MGDTMIQIEHTFEMAHRCPGHGYGEDSIHGHTWAIQATAEIPPDSEGVQDPEELYDIVKSEVIDVFDHSLLVSQSDDLIDFYKRAQEEGNQIFMVDFIPTAYNFARYLFRELEAILSEIGTMILVSVTLKEGTKVTITTTTGVITE